jgi:general secretion pathway protein A
MYTSAFGLQREPFSLTPDPGVVYLTESHQEALAGLVYAVLRQRGFIVLTSEAGLGKTTIISRMLRHLPVGRVKASVLVTPTLNRDEFLELMLFQFGIHDIPNSKAQRLIRLEQLLRTIDADGQTALLVIDEAHMLSATLLEEIRLLGNFETPEKKLLQVVLAGQPELDHLLNQEEMRQFKQRVSTRLRLDPLSVSHTAEYIRFRWIKAGGTGPHPFRDAAVTSIALASRGVPRLVNSLCDNALIAAAAEKKREVDESDILAVCRELHLNEVTPEIKRHTPFEVGPRKPDSEITEMSAPAPAPFKTLARYDSSTRKPSLLMRCASKLGMAS